MSIQFQTSDARDSRIWGITMFKFALFRNRRVTITAAALLMTVLIMGGLVRHHLVRLRQRDSHQQTTLAAAQTEPIVPALGLSRKRKGFDDAIAKLGTAAAQNHRLAVYYDKVIKRTERSSAEPHSSVRPGLESSAASAEGIQTSAASSQLVSTPAPARPSDESAKAVNPWAASPEPANPAQAHPVPVGNGAATAGDSAAGSQRAADSLVAGDMKFDVNPAISHWINYYTETRVGRSTMQQGLNRCTEYIGESRQEFKELGLPQDLVWVAQVESVWKQGAYSRVAAGGIWQFMPRTAAEYGLAVGSTGDERFDPAKETRAAATYLHDLYTLFGNWELALAAYNCGEPRLMDGIVRSGEPDFWKLYDQQLLPKETRDYVPKILAAITVASDPGAYGFTIDSMPSAGSNPMPVASSK
jgi:hypothetical protein